ncbi:S4 domain-containing protein YaaA [Gottfriedia acidiceleris]|uniref:S4 domain-containing protein YaaA n=1 Tax=Gottfriedia acidiceleris TaxID=371036 RepID=UPI002FFF9E20
MKTEKVKIKTDYITLGQFLKLAGVIDTGGMAKWFLSEHEIFVNNEPENRRGKKLVLNDTISITGKGSYIITS